MTDREKTAEEYCKSVNDDCLCQRTVPGTKYGEHIYCFCGCDIYKAVIAGWDACLKSLTEAGSEFDVMSFYEFYQDIDLGGKNIYGVCEAGARYQYSILAPQIAALKDKIKVEKLINFENKMKIKELEAKLAGYGATSL